MSWNKKEFLTAMKGIPSCCVASALDKIRVAGYSFKWCSKDFMADYFCDEKFEHAWLQDRLPPLPEIVEIARSYKRGV